MNRTEILEGGEIVEAHDTCLAVSVDGVEVFVGARVEHTGCACCANTGTLNVAYNKSEEFRVEEHGEADPLDIK